MAETSTPSQPEAPSTAATGPRPKSKARSYSAQVVRRTLGDWGARVGVTWIAIVGFFALLAPLIANSHPYLIRDADGIHSPLLRFLTPTDALLMGLVLTVALMLWLGGNGRRALIGAAVCTALALVTALVVEWASLGPVAPMLVMLGLPALTLAGSQCLRLEHLWQRALLGSASGIALAAGAVAYAENFRVAGEYALLMLIPPVLAAAVCGIHQLPRLMYRWIAGGGLLVLVAAGMATVIDQRQLWDIGLTQAAEGIGQRQWELIGNFAIQLLLPAAILASLALAMILAGTARLPAARWAFATLGATSAAILFTIGLWSLSASTALLALSPVFLLMLLSSAAGPIESVPMRLGLSAVVLLVAVSPAMLTISPPSVVVYEEHREALATGQAQWAVHAPIPYSASDRQRDSFGLRNLEPFWGPQIRAAWAGLQGQSYEMSEQEQRAVEARHWMGTDRNAADIFSRMIHASRIALAIGFVATGIAAFIGVTVGAVMGYFGGLIDLLGMRLVEIFNSIPTIMLLIGIVAFFGRSLILMMVVIGLTSWMGFALFTRAEFLRMRNQEFVMAARAAGAPLRSILFKHMLPNGMAPVLVTASFGVAAAILVESVLSFLGLGLEDQPSWGRMLSDATTAAGTFRWWIAMFPGMAIFLTVYAYNLMGEALRDAVDPHLRK